MNKQYNEKKRDKTRYCKLMIKRTSALLTTTFLTACIGSNTDSLEPHQIIESPKQRWVCLSEEAPIDVTEDKIKTNQACPRTHAD